MQLEYYMADLGLLQLDNSSSSHGKLSDPTV